MRQAAWHVPFWNGNRLLGACAMSALGPRAVQADGLDRARFREPDSMFCPGYFWMWNAKLDVAQLNAQLDDMVAHGVRSVCTHPFPKAFRPGSFHSGRDPDFLRPG